MIYAQEQAVLWPWAAPDRDALTLVITMSQSYGHVFYTDAQNDYRAWTESLRPGTYSVTDLCRVADNCGISTLSNGGASLGTVDHYSAVDTFNQLKAISAALSSGEIKLETATKHASSSGYRTYSTFTTIDRTGD